MKNFFFDCTQPNAERMSGQAFLDEMLRRLRGKAFTIDASVDQETGAIEIAIQSDGGAPRHQADPPHAEPEPEPRPKRSRKRPEGAETQPEPAVKETSD